MTVNSKLVYVETAITNII